MNNVQDFLLRLYETFDIYKDYFEKLLSVLTTSIRLILILLNPSALLHMLAGVLNMLAVYLYKMSRLVIRIIHKKILFKWCLEIKFIWKGGPFLRVCVHLPYLWGFLRNNNVICWQNSVLYEWQYKLNPNNVTQSQQSPEHFLSSALCPLFTLGWWKQIQ